MRLARAETEDDLMESTKQIRDRMLFELKEISKRSARLQKSLEVVKAKM